MNGPLAELARSIVSLSNDHASTPVLVLPRYLSLRHHFYVALVRELARLTDRPIRFDCVDTSAHWLSLFTKRLARLNAARWTAKMQSAGDATMVISATIGRPGGPRRDLVIGVCAEAVQLPTWTTAIRLGNVA